jgi:hypothetical protein
MLLDAFDVEGGKPFIQVVPLSLFILSRGGSSSRHFRSFDQRKFLIQSNQCKLIVVADVHHNQIKGGALKGFVTGAKLFKEVIVARGERAEEEHHN